jgi:rhodanese-related sulfurtransferase
MQDTREDRPQLKMLPLLALLLLLGSTGCGQAQEKTAAAASPPAARYKDADVGEYARLAAETNNIVLDVRTPREYTAGHLAGAVNLNLRAPDFAAQAARLDKGRTYLVHCAVGARSVSACQKLSELGFTNLVNLRNGIKGWEAAGQLVQR